MSEITLERETLALYCLNLISLHSAFLLAGKKNNTPTYLSCRNNLFALCNSRVLVCDLFHFQVLHYGVAPLCWFFLTGSSMITFLCDFCQPCFSTDTFCIRKRPLSSRLTGRNAVPACDSGPCHWWNSTLLAVTSGDHAVITIPLGLGTFVYKWSWGVGRETDSSESDCTACCETLWGFTLHFPKRSRQMWRKPNPAWSDPAV